MPASLPWDWPLLALNWAIIHMLSQLPLLFWYRKYDGESKEEAAL